VPVNQGMSCTVTAALLLTAIPARFLTTTRYVPVFVEVIDGKT